VKKTSSAQRAAWKLCQSGTKKITGLGDGVKHSNRKGLWRKWRIPVKKGWAGPGSGPIRKESYAVSQVQTHRQISTAKFRHGNPIDDEPIRRSPDGSGLNSSARQVEQPNNSEEAKLRDQHDINSKINQYQEKATKLNTGGDLMNTTD